MWRIVLSLTLPTFGTAAEPAPFVPETDAQAVAIAAQDAAAGGPAARRWRYLRLSDPSAKQKQQTWQAIAGHVNGQSRQPVVSSPPVILANGTAKSPLTEPVPIDWAQAALIRVNLDDYGIDPKTWEQLASQDPNYHVTLIEHYPAGKDQAGKSYAAGSQSILAAAPWLAETAEQQAAIKTLIEATQAKTPILRADNFLWQTLIQADRKVGYYGMLRIKDRSDYLKLVGLDLKASQQFTPEALAAVANSGISRQPRRVARYPSLGGGTWATFDSNLATGEFNPLRFLNGGYKHQAEEWFGLGPNGFWIVGLFAADGSRQDSAPDFVGFDHFAHSNDGRIHIGLSCFRCHTNAGVQEIRDSIKNLYRLPQVLQTPAQDAALGVQQKYFQFIAGRMARDRQIYAEALLQANGLKPEEYAKVLGDMFARYDAPVTAATAAAELGVSEETMLERFDAARKSPLGLDNALGFFTVDRRLREALPRQQWNEVYGLAQLALRGLAAWPKGGPTK